MRLEKWYADVAGGGSLVVHYGASLDIGPVAIGYDGELRSGGERRGSFSLGRNARMAAPKSLRTALISCSAWMSPVQCRRWIFR